MLGGLKEQYLLVEGEAEELAELYGQHHDVLEERSFWILEQQVEDSEERVLELFLHLLELRLVVFELSVSCEEVIVPHFPKNEYNYNYVY